MFCRFSILVLCLCCVEVSAKICKSIDIRSPTHDVHFEVLKNCTKLVGFLKLVLLEDVPSYPSFPALKEITGYLMVFLVANLYNLGDIFPNLILIRGNLLFRGNSLIIHHTNQIQKMPKICGNVNETLAKSMEMDKVSNSKENLVQKQVERTPPNSQPVNEQPIDKKNSTFSFTTYKIRPHQKDTS